MAVRAEVWRLRAFARGMVIAAVAGILFARPSGARAEGFAFAQGDQGAVAGGAVVASSSDPGSAWYNPAGLALNERTKFNVSASLYGLRFDHVTDGFTFQAEGRQLDSADLSGTQVLIISPSVVMATALRPGLTIGLGVFVTQYGYAWQSASFETQEDDPTYGPLNIQTFYDSNQNQVRYHVGPVVGWAVSRKLRLGFHLFGIYESFVNNQIATMSISGGFQAGLTEQVKDSPVHWALQPGAGLQWEIVPRLHFGLMLRGPAFMVRETPEQRFVTTVGLITPPTSTTPGSSQVATIVSPVRPDAGPGWIEPLQITSGLAWYYSRGWIDVEFEYRLGLVNTEARIDLEPTWNVRAGMMHELSRSISLGAGVFTDRSDRPKGGVNGPVDLYGFTFGLQTRTHFRGVPDEPAPASASTEPRPAPASKPLVFGTTLALRFAAGANRVNALAVGFDESCYAYVPIAFCAFPGQSTTRTTYELSLYLGSSLEF